MTTASPTPPAPAAPEATLQGWNTLLETDAARMDVLEKAFDYRGDCTLTMRDGTQTIGYIFDRRRGADPATSTVRLMTATSDDKVSVRYSDIARVEFGRDTAAGKSFETWIKKYVEKKLAGERASIESEAL